MLARLGLRPTRESGPLRRLILSAIGRLRQRAVVEIDPSAVAARLRLFAEGFETLSRERAVAARLRLRLLLAGSMSSPRVLAICANESVRHARRDASVERRARRDASLETRARRDASVETRLRDTEDVLKAILVEHH